MGRAKPTKELLCADTLRVAGAEAAARFWARMRGAAEAMATGAALRSMLFSGGRGDDASNLRSSP